MRSSLRRPSRSVSVPSETFSIESRLTAERRGMGSISSSRITSLGSRRMLVVHGATSTRPSLGIAASRERTRTGRRAMCGSSHHQTSPREGTSVTKIRPPDGTMQGRPIHRTDRWGGRRRRGRNRRVRLPGDASTGHPVLRRAASRRCYRDAVSVLHSGAPHRPWYSLSISSCHNYATIVP